MHTLSYYRTACMYKSQTIKLPRSHSIRDKRQELNKFYLNMLEMKTTKESSTLISMLFWRCHGSIGILVRIYCAKKNPACYHDCFQADYNYSVIRHNDRIL